MPQELRVLHVISDLDGYATTRQMQILARAQQSAGHRVRVGALRAEPSVLDSWRAKGIRCHHFRRRWTFDPFAWRKLLEVLSAWKPQLVHAWDLDAACNVSLAARLVRGCRLVATLPSAPTSGSRLLEAYKQVVFPTAQVKAQFLQAGADESKVCVIPPAIPRGSDQRISRAEFLAAHQLPTDSQIVLAVGPLVRAKRLDEAIWHFELVRTLNENAAMLILGDGTERHRLERYARLVSEPETIKFLGYRADMSAYLSLADVVWHTGEEQGISVAVLEAMAAGVPVVASDVPVNRTLIEPGRTGFLAAAKSRPLFARHTLKLFEDSDLVARVGTAAAQATAEPFSADRQIKAYQRLYAEVLEDSPA